MSTSELKSNGPINAKRDLVIGLDPESKFICDICKQNGEILVCWCRKCNKLMHPSCAEVDAWIYDVDGEVQYVLPSTENIANSCPNCLELAGSKMIKRPSLQRSSDSNIDQLVLCQPSRNIDQLSFQNPFDRSLDQLSFHHHSDISMDRLSSSLHQPFDISTNQLSLSIAQPSDHSIINQSFHRSPGSSITSFLESGMGPAHKTIEGDSHYMIHVNKRGHQLKQMDNCTNYNCSGCKIEGFGEHYKCENSSCHFILHKECMYPRKLTEHQFFPEFTFAFSGTLGTSNSKSSKKEHTDIFCNACGLEVNGYFYHSFDGIIKLHPVCINLPMETICGERNEKMVLREKTTRECSFCRNISSKVDHQLTDHIWSYVGVDENIHLHVGCIIKMFTELKRDSMGQLISCKMSCKNRVGKINLLLVLHDAKMKCEKKYKTFTKYAKFALGAVIAALLGDATTLFVTTMVAISSK